MKLYAVRAPYFLIDGSFYFIFSKIDSEKVGYIKNVRSVNFLFFIEKCLLYNVLYEKKFMICIFRYTHTKISKKEKRFLFLIFYSEKWNSNAKL